MSSAIEIQLIAILLSIACSIPGCFLILRKMSMMCDAISHTILLGIVLSFFIVRDLDSLFLFMGATIIGMVTVWCIELIIKTDLIKEDASIGIIFPLFFSIAIILITFYANDIHLDTDAVLLGELAFAPFKRLKLFGIDIGAKALYTSLSLLILNSSSVLLFYKELKISTFAPILATTLGISSTLIHYGLMTIVSLTTVVSFDAVGSILVIAFMVVPANTAYLISKDLKWMIIYSCGFGALSAIIGYQVAYYFDVSIAGMIVVILGILFILVYLLNKNSGIVYHLIKSKEKNRNIITITLLSYLIHHNNFVRKDDVLDLFSNSDICYAISKDYIYEKDGYLYLLDKGIFYIKY